MRLQLAPQPADLFELENAQPGNPFATRGYAEACRNSNAELALVQLHAADPRSWALALVRHGRLSRHLEIPSLSFPLDSVTLSALCDEAVTAGVTDLEIATFGSPAEALIFNEDGGPLHNRTEFIIDLAAHDHIEDTFSTLPRRKIRQARKCGVVVQEVPSRGAIDLLRSLHARSMDRRAGRGEKVSQGELPMGQEMLDHAGARVFAARYQEQFVSAVLMAMSRESGYLMYSGNAPDGMRVGAAHCLIAEVAIRFQLEGLQFLNLGGVGLSQDGLADFKRRFGASSRQLATLQLDIARGWRRSVRVLGALWRGR